MDSEPNADNKVATAPKENSSSSPSSGTKKAERNDDILDLAKRQILRYGDENVNAELLKDKDISEIDRIPTTTRYNLGTSEITVIATAHSYKPEAAVNRIVTEQVSSYAEDTSIPKEKKVVVIEGFQETEIPHWKNRNSATAQSAEAGTAAFSAQEHGITVISPEVPFKKSIARLKEVEPTISDDEIALYHIFRSLPNRMNEEEEIPLLEFVPLIIGEYARFETAKSALSKPLQEITAWFSSLPSSDRTAVMNYKNQPPSPELMHDLMSRVNTIAKESTDIFNEITQKEIGEPMFEINNGVITLARNESFIRGLCDPGTPGKGETPDTVFRRISKNINEGRDEYILEAVDNLVQSGKSPFIVFGAAHITNLTPALELLYNRKKHEESELGNRD